MGSGLAVQVTTMSCCAMCSGRSVSAIERAPNRAASSAARSVVRFANVTLRGLRAQKCVAHSSIISPAPMNSIDCSARSG